MLLIFEALFPALLHPVPSGVGLILPHFLANATETRTEFLASIAKQRCFVYFDIPYDWC
jgi:hypothetical protein